MEEIPMVRTLRLALTLLALALALTVSPALLAQDSGDTPAEPAPIDPQLAFHQGTVELTGFTPGGEVVLLHLARRSGPTVVLTHGAEVLVDEDEDGAASFELTPTGSGGSSDSAPGVPVKSLWVAVDRTTGETVWAFPRGDLFAPPTLDLPEQALSRGPQGLLHRIERTGARLQAFLVRPAEGVWSLSLGDGGVHDQDGEGDGVISFLVDAMEPVGAAAGGPQELADGDVLVLVDPRTLAHSVVRIEQGRPTQPGQPGQAGSGPSHSAAAMGGK